MPARTQSCTGDDTPPNPLGQPLLDVAATKIIDGLGTLDRDEIAPVLVQ